MKSILHTFTTKTILSFNTKRKLKLVYSEIKSINTIHAQIKIKIKIRKKIKFPNPTNTSR